MEPTDLLDPLEADRQRIGAEIHDELLPYLFATAAKISALRRSDSELDESLADVADWVDQSRAVARNLIRDVSLTDEIVDDPLTAAKKFLQSIRVEGESGPQIAWEFGPQFAGEPIAGESLGPSPLKGRLAAGVAAATYRVVCEAVRNSMRHANARKITVSCQPQQPSQKTNDFCVKVVDDGCGMDPAINTKETQSGLGWMKMRALLSGIDLQVESTAGRGTSVLLRIHVDKDSLP